METADAQAELLRLWLAAFGPATETDIRWWAGWTARDARAAFAMVAHVVVDLDGARGFVLADDLEPVEQPEPAAALLPHARPDDHGLEGARLVPRPLRSGSLRLERQRRANGVVERQGRRRLVPAARRGDRVPASRGRRPGRLQTVETEAARVEEWLGDKRFSPGFLPPFQRELATG